MKWIDSKKVVCYQQAVLSPEDGRSFLQKRDFYWFDNGKSPAKY
jgi:hypothetical protein